MKKLILFFLTGMLIFLYGCGGGGGSVNPVPTQIPNRTVSGVVIDSAGDLVSGVTVTLRSNNDNVVTTDNGAFSLTFSPNINFIVSVSAPGHKGALFGGNTGSDINNLEIVSSDDTDGIRPSVLYIKN